MAGKAKKIADLPAKGTNRHWTKSLVAAPNGWLYVGVGADSNIGEKGMANEVRRAAVLEVRPENGYVRTFAAGLRNPVGRSEEHTSELQSLMRISYAVFCLKKKNNKLQLVQDVPHKT